MKRKLLQFTLITLMLVGCSPLIIEPALVTPTPQSAQPSEEVAEQAQPPTTDAAQPTPLPAGWPGIMEVYPLALGAAWTYHVTVDYDTEKGLQHFDGTVTETIIEATPMIENWVFHSQITDHPLMPDPASGWYYAATGSGLYRLADAESAANATNPVTIANYAAYQILAWPMELGQMMGDPALMNADGRNVWKVESDDTTIDLPAGHFEGCYIVSMLTNPDDSHRWFCPGTGVVMYEYHHHGTRLDEIWELVNFAPGS